MTLEPLYQLLGLSPVAIAASTPRDKVEHVTRLIAIGNLLTERGCTAAEVRAGVLGADIAMQQGASAYRAYERGLRLVMTLRAFMPTALQPEDVVTEAPRVH